MFTRIVNIESVFSLSLVNFMLEQRNLTRERLVGGGATENSERNWFCLMWNSFTGLKENGIYKNGMITSKAQAGSQRTRVRPPKK